MIEMAGLRVQLFTVKVLILADQEHEAVDAETIGEFIEFAMCECQENRPKDWLYEKIGNCVEEDVVDAARVGEKSGIEEGA